MLNLFLLKSTELNTSQLSGQVARPPEEVAGTKLLSGKLRSRTKLGLPIRVRVRVRVSF